MRWKVTVLSLVSVALLSAGSAGARHLPAPTIVLDPTASDTLEASRLRMMQEVLAKIAGRESEPAESVFTNIRVLKGFPAGRIPAMMNFGFGKSLGVGCAHCHVADEYARDDSTTKQIARGMFRMVRRINTELLKEIPELADRDPIVNCTTCHRGATKPATEML